MTAHGPTALWYATRGAGVTTMLLLTASVVLGIGEERGWRPAKTPRFAIAALHRTISMLALAILGACQVTYYATTNTLLQVLVPGRLRGRVLSIYIMTSWGAIPIGNLLAGAVAERYGAPVALAGGGLITLAVAVGVALAYQPLRIIHAERARAATA